jgi:hypothetical protein
MTVAASLVAAGLVRALQPHTRWRLIDSVLYVAVVAAVLGYLAWIAWPALLPPGSGPDLTHHLLLIDYIERHGHLLDVRAAGAHLGEMAHYTPGLHLLTVIAGRLTGVDGFHALYPVVAGTVALKFGCFLLILLRLLSDHPARMPLALAGVLLVGVIPTFAVGSFLHDSFLAQVVSELFAMTAWWALVAWDQQPRRVTLLVFAAAIAAAFLTWPVWIGPPVVTLIVLIGIRQGIPMRERLVAGAMALALLVPVGAVHVTGRLTWTGIIGTSGAVHQPSPATLGWWLPALSIAGLLLATRARRYRTLTIFTAALLLQAVALALVATSRGATTPYMAIKMIYLGIYPGVAGAVLVVAAVVTAVSHLRAVARVPTIARAPMMAWIVVAMCGVLAANGAAAGWKTRPVVSHELWAAGQWARGTLPAACVDYLVDSEYTAYWLHLAVLGNPRATPRSTDDDTFLPAASFARWLMPGGVPYAIADLRVLPNEIKRDVDVLQQFGAAAVIKRQRGGACP